MSDGFDTASDDGYLTDGSGGNTVGTSGDLAIVTESGDSSDGVVGDMNHYGSR
jgi:hypothetical protein